MHDHPFLARFRIALQQMAVSGQGILLAVSGGADSMAMLRGVLLLKDELGISPIVVAHLNHGLRGQESDEDAKMVEQISATARLPCVVATIASEALKLQSEGSLEESARNARYDFLIRTAEKFSLPQIATAHHQQDQAETALFNILRGTGLRGLRGIPETREVSPQLRIIRPMLHIDREIVRDFVVSARVEYRDDSSNATPEFTRNRIRMAMNTMASSQSEQLRTRLLKLTDQAARTMDSIDLVASKILSLCLQSESSESVCFDRSKLLAWPEPLVRHALILQWTRQSWPRRQMNSNQWQRLSNAVATGSPRRWSFPGGIMMSVKKRQFFLDQTIEPKR